MVSTKADEVATVHGLVLVEGEIDEFHNLRGCLNC